MNYKEIISNPQYKEIASINHSDIKSFLMKEIPDNHGWARIANMYQLVSILALMLGLFKAFMPFYTSRESVFLIYFALGVVFAFTIIIILHELIHAIAYVCLGIRNLSFGINLRKFLFYVQADEQVVNYKQLKIVALAPAITIAVLSFIGMLVFYKDPLFYFFLSVFGIHSFFCSGDFAMLCFFQNRPKLDIVTFDIKKEGKTYFYAQKLEQ